MTGNFADQYFNHAWLQISVSISKLEEARISETIAMIPQDCSSILDLGCGDGRITNVLVKKYEHVCGLDSSEEALKHVVSEKKLGSLDSLPFEDKSFDTILCSEVLEHLPFRTYNKALQEMERVAGKYILVTVPNNQNRKLSSVICPYCGCRFEPDRHIRSFTSENMKGLFGQFRLKVVKTCVPAKTYPNYALQVRKLLNPIFKTPFPSVAMCPQCGYSALFDNRVPANNSSSDNDKSLPLSRLATKLIPKRQQGIWLGALYERN
jgi:ubiquinone/menaquinone biosynthesis C-methylase UbiE